MRILLIEDEQKLAQAVKSGLEQETMAVDIANDGEYGLDLAMGEQYDAIILDLMLPGMSGQEICISLRNKGKKTPILMLTALSETSDKVEGLNLGADDYLTKPFDFDELLARIRVLTRRQGEKKTILTVDDLEIDTITFQVSRGGKQINLSKKEYALLEYMMHHKNKIISKDSLIAHVWDFDADVLPNTVEVMMGNLRKKIDKPFARSKQLLTTVRGFGYKIKE